MHFNEHYGFEGKHAFLSPSQHSWLRYTEDHLVERYSTMMAAQRGTKLHEFAAEAIRLGVKLKGNNTTLAMYVNDAIGFRMQAEQTLYFSENCFGTADAIAFKGKKLRIHDLKTGVTKVSMDQLKIYAALFCLEYNFRPAEIEIELRIYQSNEVLICEPEPEEIFLIMETIKRFDAKIEELKSME